MIVLAGIMIIFNMAEESVCKVFNLNEIFFFLINRKPSVSFCVMVTIDRVIHLLLMPR